MRVSHSSKSRLSSKTHWQKKKTLKREKERKEEKDLHVQWPFMWMRACVHVRVHVCVCACACVRVCVCVREKEWVFVEEEGKLSFYCGLNTLGGTLFWTSQQQLKLKSSAAIPFLDFSQKGQWSRWHLPLWTLTQKIASKLTRKLRLCLRLVDYFLQVWAASCEMGDRQNTKLTRSQTTGTFLTVTVTMTLLPTASFSRCLKITVTYY